MSNNKRFIIIGLIIIIFLIPFKSAKQNVYSNKSVNKIEVNFDYGTKTDNITSYYNSLEEIAEDPEKVFSLKITGVGINNSKSISKYENIEYLEIYECEINNFSFLKNLKDLKCLKISYSKSKNFSSIKNLPNKENLLYLEIAYCKNNDNSPITDIGYLKGFTGLVYLSLCGNDIKNLDAVSSMKNLETLYIYDNNNITTLKPLYNLPNLSTGIISSSYIYTDEDIMHLGDPMSSNIYYD